jgi:enhancer of polycomb-like protein
VLVDDYDPKILRYTMTLFHEQDAYHLMTDPTIYVQSADGRPQQIIPFRLGPQQPIIRRDPQRAYPPGTVPSISAAAQLSNVVMSMPLPTNGTPISVQAQMKKMQPPTGLPQMRISSNGGMRPPAQPIAASMQPPPPQPPQQPNHTTPPRPSPTPTVNGINGTNRSVNPPESDATVPNPNPNPSSVNGTQNQLDTNLIPIDGNTPRQLLSPALPKAQIQQPHVVLPNGYHLTAMNGYPPMPNGAQYTHSMNGPHNGLSIQQMQNLKTAFASSVPPGQDLNSLHANGRLPASFIAHSPNGGNFDMRLAGGVSMNMKLPSARPMQWNGSPTQRPTSVLNGGESGVINGSMSPSPSLAHSIPVRSPSANGVHVAIRGTNVGHVLQGAHSMSPHMHSPSPLPSGMIHSPPRPSHTPNIVMASPSTQHLQPVVGNQGY